MESTSFFSQVHPLLKANSQIKRTKNGMENEKSRETEATGGGEWTATAVAATMARGVHDGLVAVGSTPVSSSAPRTRRFV